MYSTMKNKFFLFAPFFLVLLFFSCGTVRSNTGNDNQYKINPFVPYRALDADIPFIIEDYEGKSAGAQMPAWLGAYLEGGIDAVETIDQYNGRYYFVAESSGLLLDMLNRRAARIKLDREFPSIAIFRIYKRFVENLNTWPDVVYGPAFETFMKHCMETRWPGTRKESNCWAFVHWTAPYAGTPQDDDADDDATPRDAYKLFMLFSIDKNDFERQFYSLSAGIQFDKNYNRTQAAAFRDACAFFFAGF
jgi:hypothetical protein